MSIFRVPPNHLGPPREGGRCRGWSRNVEGWGDSSRWTYRKSKFQSFQVSKFQRSTDSLINKFHCMFSKFQGFRDSKIPFHVFDRYCSHIQYVQEISRRLVRIFGPRLFHIFNIFDVRHLYIPHKHVSQKMFRFVLFEILHAIWCIQSWRQLVLGVMVTSTRSENHANEGRSGFPKIKSKSY